VKGVVAGGSRQTVDAGAAMLRAGGNAVDAAVAAALACFVAECSISTLGGGGFGLVAGPDADPVLYDFFVDVPGRGADAPPPDMDFARLPIVFEDSVGYYHVGRASSGVPGNLAGLAQLLADRGTMSLADVLQPAIALAREGFTLSGGQAYLIRLVGDILLYTPGSAAIFAPDGHALGEGEHFANPAFADTLEHIAAAGWQTLYTGALADALVTDHRTHGGLITADDLAAYRVIKRQPLHLTYRGQTLYTNPPPSLGGILIAYALGVLDHAGLDGLRHSDAEHIALLAEVMRQANIARHADHPERFTTPDDWANWLDANRLAAGWQAVEARLRVGPPIHSPDGPGGPSSTTHISALDADGLAVGITVTPGETGGYAVGDTGLLMNNMLGEADINPNGFHRWPPGMRLSSMMAPTLITDADGPRMVIGSGGSNRLRSAILQTVSNMIDWDLPADEAANRARVHFEHDLLDLEAGIAPDVADQLEAGGYRVNRWTAQSLYFGGAHIAVRLPDGRLTGAGDRRRGGTVAVVE
jgi:gamma-glutamyltranspeptidase/glutathione hydrolase